MTEHDEQVNFVNWFEYKFPNIRLFAVPNGGKRHASVGKQLKAEGVRRGVPDIFIPELKLFIEMKKAKGGRVSKEQKEWLGYLESVGYVCEVCRGADEAKKVILDLVSQRDK